MKSPIHESEVPWETWYGGTEREIRGKPLADVGGRARVGFGLLELPPGSNTLPAHYHTKEEEHLYALEGEAILHLGAESIPLGPGSYVCFPASQELAHYLQNTSEAPFRYLIVGERIREDEVMYPGGGD